MDKASFGHRIQRSSDQRRAALSALDYGWANNQVRALCRANRELIDFVVAAPSETKHYVMLCLTGLNRQGQPSRPLLDLARVIAAQPRRALLNELWDADLGSTRGLMRLGREVFEHDTYHELAIVLGSPARRAALRDTVHITPAKIARIADAGPDHLTTFRGRLIATYGGEGATFILNGLMCLRPDLAPDEIRLRLNALELPKKIDRLLGRLVIGNGLPDPPWRGDATIRPLATIADLRLAGRRLDNCLAGFPIWAEALSGERAFYLAEGEEVCVIALARHRLFGTWFLHSLAKRANGAPSLKRKQAIVAAFARAGFPYFGGAPISDLTIG